MPSIEDHVLREEVTAGIWTIGDEGKYFRDQALLAEGMGFGLGGESIRGR